MRFVDIKEPGDVSGMVIGDTEIPQLGAGDVLIKVAYAGVNRPDVIQRLGLYPPPPGASPILGLEVSGVVAGVGSEVDKYRLGDEVCALTNGG
ncbi:MAG: NADPH2:quinone reductase, partial [Paraglaciecola psychrophila]